MKRILIILATLFATAQSQTIQTIGAPTTTVVSRGNFRTDSILYLPKRQKLPTDSGAVRYQISDSSVYYWTGFQWRRLGVHIDTAAMLLPYLRDADTTAMLSPYLKESDTTFLSNRINVKVNISDTSSMLTNYIRHAGNGLTKSGQSLSVDTSAMATRARVQKGIDSVASIASGNISGTLTTNYIPKATGTSSIGNSIAYDNGTEILLNTTSDVGDYKLQSNGNIYTKGKIDISSNDPVGLSVYRLTSSEVYAQVFNTTGWAYMGAERSTGGGLVPNSRPNAAIFASGYVAPIQFAIDTNIRATIDTFGNVGIGVLPTERLHVNGRIRATTIDSIASPINMLTADVNGVIKKSAISTGTVTSVATGYGLSGGTITTTGTISADTLQLSTRAWRQKGLDSLAALEISGSGTTNYVPKFTDTRTVGNSQIIDDGTQVLIATTSDAGAYTLQVNGAVYNTLGAALAASSGNIVIGNTSTGNVLLGASSPAISNGLKYIDVEVGNASGIGPELILHNSSAADAAAMAISFTGVRSGANVSSQIKSTRRGILTFHTQDIPSATPNTPPERARISADGELLLNTTTDAGDYKLQVSGNIIATNTNGQIRATNGTVSAKLQIVSTLGLVGTETNHPFALYTNNQERVRVAESGNVGINNNTPNASAILDVASTTQGFLPPRMTTTQRDAISSPAAGLVIYNTTTSKLQVYTTSWTDLH